MCKMQQQVREMINKACKQCCLIILSLSVVVFYTVEAVPCSQTTCGPNIVCKDVYDRNTGVVSGQCLTNPEVTGNENACLRGNPLFVSANPSPLEASCQPDTQDRFLSPCPQGYFCFFNPPVCCPAFTKDTTCPATKVEGVIGGVCVDTCQSDAQCPGDRKCCTTTCGGTFCQSPDPIAPPIPTCASKRCGPGERCTLLKGPCPFPPCAPVPTCVNSLGVCPKQQFSWQIYLNWCQKRCTSDSQCPPLHKCCLDYFQCGTSCQPGCPSFTCQNWPCSPNQQCVMQKDPTCTAIPCYDVPACIEKAPVIPTLPRPQGDCDPACQQLLFLLALMDDRK